MPILSVFRSFLALLEDLPKSHPDIARGIVVGMPVSLGIFWLVPFFTSSSGVSLKDHIGYVFLQEGQHTNKNLHQHLSRVSKIIEAVEYASFDNQQIVADALRHSACIKSREVREPIALASAKECIPNDDISYCLLYTSPSPRDATLSRMPSSA